MTPTLSDSSHPGLVSVVFWWLVFSSLLPAPADAVWVWPTTGPQQVVRDFEAPLTPWGPGHRGLDLAASSDLVVAPVSGTVSFEGFVVDRGVLTITTLDGWKVSMEPVNTELDIGAHVTRGDVLGNLHEGHCDKRCLHIGLRVDDRYRSPARELGVEQRAVLLPW